MGKVETWKENTLLSDLQRSTFMNWQVYEAERDDNLVGLKNLACCGFFFSSIKLCKLLSYYCIEEIKILRSCFQKCTILISYIRNLITFIR